MRANDRISELSEAQGRRQRNKKRLAALGGIVALAVALALMLPALAMTALTQGSSQQDAQGSALVATSFSETGSSDSSAAAPADSGHPAQSFSYELTDDEGNVTLSVSVEAPVGALPANATMQVEPVAPESIAEAVEGLVGGQAGESVDAIQAVDIAFFDAGGNEIEPADVVSVKLTSSVIAESDEQRVVHVSDEGTAELVSTLDDEQLKDRGQALGNDEVLFDAHAFSIYGIVGITIQKSVLASDGHNYRISVTYGPEAAIPEGTELIVTEIEGETSAYEDYLAKTSQALEGDKLVSFARFFDIALFADGAAVQPQAPVDVTIEVADDLVQGVQAVHFEHDGKAEAAVLLDASLEETDALGNAVSFTTEGFSVYGLVQADSYKMATSVDDLANKSYYLSIDNDNARYYFKNVLNGNYIGRTSTADIAAGSPYTFEPMEDAANQFYLSTTGPDGQRQYVKLLNNNGNITFSAEKETVFTVELQGDDATQGFYIYCFRSDNANKLAFWFNDGGFSLNANKKQARNSVVLTEVLKEDPLGLDGKSFGIVNNKDTVSGTALMTNPSNSNTRLSGRVMTVRTEPVKRTENVFVANDATIAFWTFSHIEGSSYYIATTVGSEVKYLRIGESAVTLVSAADLDDKCKIQVDPGTGTMSGKYMFSTSDGSTLYLDGTTFRRANDVTKGASNSNYWMNLAELSNLRDDDFVVYTAQKVSVSGTVNEDGSIDYDVKDGDRVIVYTRIWNDQTLRYDYYTVDYDGMLVKAYSSGDTLSWVGSKVNTMLWDFVEYHYLDDYGNDTGVPNYYYELCNAYSGKYIAPQVSESGFLSDSTIGINLNGRRNGEYYTTVLAWDDPYYDYASLKVKDWQLTSAPISKADTFYFAVMQYDEDETEKLTTVETIDSKPYGITLKMQNYANVASNGRSQTQTDVLQDLTYNQYNGVKNLLTKYIPDGQSYPVSTKTGNSLGNLFNDALTVNNQFLMSTYKETGYFEFDSTQNFAHLVSDETDKWFGQPAPGGGTYQVGDFVIYDQIASTTESNGPTRQHGQFFPYNDIQENTFITNFTNSTDIGGNQLSSLDPRKGEKLYALHYKNAANTDPAHVDFFFGMEMNASFMQSASGLDAWGHDLIFEFSGDDDFWLYIDDMLVLDLGGIHSALPGSVNFRTGEVIENGKKSTLRERFETAYKAKNNTATQAEVDEWLDGLFKENEAGVKTVFKDYSGHVMKMYYMERGAGASNLHMRFNLAPYTNGEVLLQKEISGVETVDAGMAFPFQIYYDDGTRPDGSYGLLGRDGSVVDARTHDPIPFQETYTVGGTTYENVFLVKPGQTAAIGLPSEDVKYYFTECGIDTSIYDSVKANDETLRGKAVEGASDLADFQTDETTVAARKQVIYNNHVSTEAQHSLTVTKKLWRDFAMQEPLPNDDAEFRFRVYIGKNGNDYTVYNTGKYYVRDQEGNYCTYSDGFKSTGKKSFDDLSAETPEGEWKSEQEQATFHTSPGGAVDKIPAGYSIEIPGLMDGTAYFVEERDYEIPAGYNLIGYELQDSTHGAAEGGSQNSGTIDGDDPTIIVNNQHGYGLVVNKVWSDADFMDDHDEIYFGVYDKASGKLVKDTLRQLGKTETSITWFFTELDKGKTLNDYEVYEVSLPEKPLSVGAEGVVQLADGVVPTRIEENGTLNVGGKTNEHGYSENFVYTANYSREELTQQQISDGANSRTDTVTNSRPGIKLVKTDLNGSPLAGARFSFVKVGDERAGKRFTSNDEGLIAVAYLVAGSEYTLTETAAPYRHKSLIDPLTIKVDEKGVLYVNGKAQAPEDGFYTVMQETNPTVENMPTVTVKNRPITLKATKVDAQTGEPLAGITFALYREVTDYEKNVPMPDYGPMEGFESLVTDDAGVIPRINLDDLSVGNYYLREKDSTIRYVQPDYDIQLGILDDGTITARKAAYSKNNQMYMFSDDASAAEVQVDDDGNITVQVKNTPAKGVRILKVGSDNTSQPLAGAEFALYRSNQVENNRPKPDAQPLITVTTDEEGRAALGALETNVPYLLFETHAPDGYEMLASPISISMAAGGKVSASLDSKPLDVAMSAEKEPQITIQNNPGVALPSTGGPGAGLVYAAGTLLVCLALVFLFRSRISVPHE